MKIAIDSVEIRRSETKGEYAHGKATIMKEGGSENMVFMSFGPSFESVRDLLVGGATIEVNAVPHGSILKILSPSVARS